MNKFEEHAGGGRLGIMLTGDFAQLPPVNAPWVFEAGQLAKVTRSQHH